MGAFLCLLCIQGLGTLFENKEFASKYFCFSLVTTLDLEDYATLLVNFFFKYSYFWGNFQLYKGLIYCFEL